MWSTLSSRDNWIIHKQTRTALEVSTLTFHHSWLWIHYLLNSRQAMQPFHHKGAWIHDLLDMKQACKPFHHRGYISHHRLHCTGGKHTNRYNTTTFVCLFYNCRVVLKLVWQNTASYDFCVLDVICREIIRYFYTSVVNFCLKFACL